MVLSLCDENIRVALSNKINIDYKTLLQEFSQRDSKKEVEYVLREEKGPDNNKTFFMTCF